MFAMVQHFPVGVYERVLFSTVSQQHLEPFSLSPFMPLVARRIDTIAPKPLHRTTQNE